MKAVRKIIECVPNFSEGCRKEVISAIKDGISNSPGCTLLDVDPGESTNRTVYTFVGSPDDVIEGAMAAARIAYNLIDMSKHKGEHPRMGAMDVCPFIPVKGATMDDCLECARTFGYRLGSELQVPVYLYGAAATRDERKKLPQVRTGEYEALPEKLKNEEWTPDFGPASFVPKWGATAVGARKFLLALNVNLLATKEQAHRIALNVRELGRGASQPGRLKNVAAIGWWLDEENLAQVSMNLTDYDVTPLHVAYEECKRDAEELNLPILGSQIVGVLPLEPVLRAAEYYIEKENLFLLEDEQKIKLVVNRMGLGTLAPFKPREKIIEYMIEDFTDGELVTKSTKEFICSVAARTSAPGGGSVSATIGALGCALSTMVGQLTYGKKQFEALDATMRRLIPVFHSATTDLLPLIDADTSAFSEYMAALKLPQKTTEEADIRKAAMDDGLKQAIDVPLQLARTINKLWPTLVELAHVANINTTSDLQVAARCLETAVFGAYYNVAINLKSIQDVEYTGCIQAEAQEMIKNAQRGCVAVLQILEER